MTPEQIAANRATHTSEPGEYLAIDEAEHAMYLLDDSGGEVRISGGQMFTRAVTASDWTLIGNMLSESAASEEKASGGNPATIGYCRDVCRSLGLVLLIA